MNNLRHQSKKFYSIQDFTNVVDEGLLKSKKKSERYFDLTSDEWVTIMSTDGFSIHKEAFKKGNLGSSSLKSDDYKLIDKKGNIYSVDMPVGIIEELFPRSFKSSVNNAEYFGRHSVVVLDGAIQGDEIVPFDSYLCFVYDQETQKVIDISYQQ